MRYFKGAIAISAEKDLPLLRQVMYGKYVTQTQLWQFMRHSGCEKSRGAFLWRAKRLADHGFIARHVVPMLHDDPVFAIAAAGVVCLVEGFGMAYSGPDGGPEIRPDAAGVAHAVGVNAVHLDLLRSGQLVSWENEIEMRYRNELEGLQNAKEYDAIATLSLGGRQLRIGLEYERTPKSKAEYDDIIARLAGERNVERVLYLAGTSHIQSLLLARFSRKSARVFIALASDLRKLELANLEVVDAQTMRAGHLIDIP